MQKLVALIVMAAMLTPSIALASVGSKNATYFGGTAGFKDAKEPVEGVLDTKNETALVFSATDKAFRGQTLSIGKDIVRTTVPIVETRSGKKVTYQDEEAKKSVK